MTAWMSVCLDRHSDTPAPPQGVLALTLKYYLLKAIHCCYGDLFYQELVAAMMGTSEAGGLHRSLSSPATMNAAHAGHSALVQFSEQLSASAEKPAPPECIVAVNCRQGAIKQAAGYQASMCLKMVLNVGESFPATCFHYSASFGL